MKVLDMFSWLPEKEISLEQLEQIFKEYYNGTYNGEYGISFETPDNIENNILNCSIKLMKEGKKIAYILKDDRTIAVMGYSTAEYVSK